MRDDLARHVFMFRSASPEDNNIGTDPFRDRDRGRLKFGFLYRSLKCEDKRTKQIHRLHRLHRLRTEGGRLYCWRLKKVPAKTQRRKEKNAKRRRRFFNRTSIWASPRFLCALSLR